jgi:hypothetical protein
MRELPSLAESDRKIAPAMDKADAEQRVQIAGSQHPILAIGRESHPKASGIAALCKTSSNPSRPASLA